MSHDHPHPPDVPHSHPHTAPPQPGWVQRNWKWALPVGCMGAFALLLIFILGLILAIFAGIKQSDAYKNAYDRAVNDPNVIAALGQPIEPGFLVSGSIDVTGPSGSADLAIPLNGPNGAATLYAVATKEAGEWTYQRLELELASGERLSLLEGGPAPEPEL